MSGHATSSAGSRGCMGACSPRPLRVASPHSYTLRVDSDVGGEVYERMLLERLPAHGIQPLLGLPRGGWPEPRPPDLHVATLRHSLGLHWTRAPAVFVPWLVAVLRTGSVQLLRGHSVRHTGPSLLIARRLVRSRVPIVIHHHHFTPRWRALEAAILRRADGVITVSMRSRGELVAAGVAAERVHVALDGVARPPRQADATHLWPHAGLRLLHLGRLEERKRPSLAIEALALARSRGLDASLVIAGDGEQRAQLLARSHALGVAESVSFLGRVPEQLKWRLYDSAELLLFCSELEGFGLVVAEAQSRGLPAIVAAGTAAAEAVAPGASGIVTQPTADAFATALVQLADPAARAAMAIEARRFAARFDWDACAAAVARVYRSLAGC
jgi:glycosyltransferase involved in cell wall biosynthesis